ncbi:hypothetical protein U1Q18_005228 [Sarracenia purpurea var. burkii]
MGNQSTQYTGMAFSLEDRQEKEISSKSPRIGETEGTISSRRLESNQISNFKSQEFILGSPFGNNSEKQFIMSRMRRKDYLPCEDSAPQKPGRREDLHQSKGPNGMQIAPRSSEITGNKSPNRLREGLVIPDPSLISSLETERVNQSPPGNMEDITKSGPNFSHRRRSEIHNGPSQALYMEGGESANPAFNSCQNETSGPKLKRKRGMI